MDVLTLLDRPIAFHRCFVDLTGSITAALFLSQAVYWQRRVPEDRAGWWFKSQTEWTEEIGLSRREQETARLRLKQIGVLQEERRGVPAKLWYRIDEDTLSVLLRDLASRIGKRTEDGPDEPDHGSGATNPLSLAENANQDRTNPPNGRAAPENPRLAETAHQDRTMLPAQVDPIQIGAIRPSGLAEVAHSDRPVPPISKRKQRLLTETTTQPPPQTPPPLAASGSHRGGVETVARRSPGSGTEAIEPGPPTQNDWVYPNGFSGPEREAAARLLEECPADARQAVLDVLAATLQAGEIRKSTLSVLRGLVRRARDGSFDPGPGLHLAAERERHVRVLAAVAESRRQSLASAPWPFAAPERAPPWDHIEALKRALHGRARPGTPPFTTIPAAWHEPEVDGRRCERRTDRERARRARPPN